MRPSLVGIALLLVAVTGGEAQTSVTLARLHYEIEQAVGPIQGVEVGVFGNPATVKVTPPSKQQAAQPTINAFDWSAHADALYVQAANRKTTEQAVPQQGGASQGMAIRSVLKYLVQEMNVVRAGQPMPIASLTRVGTTATVTTRWPHELTTGVTVYIQGVSVPAYNGPFVITNLSPTSFTYQVSGNPAVPNAGAGTVYSKISGFPILDFNKALSDVQAIINSGGAD
jgi:hypothetical protein